MVDLASMLAVTLFTRLCVPWHGIQGSLLSHVFNQPREPGLLRPLPPWPSRRLPGGTRRAEITHRQILSSQPYERRCAGKCNSNQSKKHNAAKLSCSKENPDGQLQQRV